jgi:DNA-directed RNA polymerase specialized sigma54-like protein
MLISFLDLVMRTARDDNAISPGEKVETNKMMNIIAQNPSLTEALRMVANQTKSIAVDGSDRQRLERILKKFKNEGYLEEVNKEEEIFQFTGKVEYVQEVIGFLMQHDQISQEDEAFDARKVSA